MQTPPGMVSSFRHLHDPARCGLAGDPEAVVVLAVLQKGNELAESACNLQAGHGARLCRCLCRCLCPSRWRLEPDGPAGHAGLTLLLVLARVLLLVLARVRGAVLCRGRDVGWGIELVQLTPESVQEDGIWLQPRA